MRIGSRIDCVGPLTGARGLDSEVEEDAHLVLDRRHSNSSVGIQCVHEVSRMASGMVHIRVDTKVKAKAAKTLAKMGLTVSDAVRILLTRVAAEKAMPFEIRVPNRETREAIEACERGEVFRASTVAELMKDLNSDD